MCFWGHHSKFRCPDVGSLGSRGETRKTRTGTDGDGDGDDNGSILALDRSSASIYRWAAVGGGLAPPLADAEWNLATAPEMMSVQPRSQGAHAEPSC